MTAELSLRVPEWSLRALFRFVIGFVHRDFCRSDGDTQGILRNRCGEYEMVWVLGFCLKVDNPAVGRGCWDFQA